MGINVHLENERGETLDDVIDTEDLISGLLPHWQDTSSHCLRFIDPYADTTFNHRQISVFLEEWERIKPNAKTEEQRIIWYAVKDLASLCQKGDLLYLKFYGD
jgi:hypothetical protein